MNKRRQECALRLIYKPERPGAKYSLDGKKFLNAGELAEVLDRYTLGLSLKNDCNTSFDEGSDIPEYEASVKSSKFTLTTKNLGNNFEDILRGYFSAVPSRSWHYVSFTDNIITVYEMDRAEFEEFLRAWAGYEKSRHIVRLKTESRKMIAWLEARV